MKQMIIFFLSFVVLFSVNILLIKPHAPTVKYYYVLFDGIRYTNISQTEFANINNDSQIITRIETDELITVTCNFDSHVVMNDKVSKTISVSGVGTINYEIIDGAISFTDFEVSDIQEFSRYLKWIDLRKEYNPEDKGIVSKTIGVLLSLIVSYTGLFALYPKNISIINEALNSIKKKKKEITKKTIKTSLIIYLTIFTLSFAGMIVNIIIWNV